MDALQIADQHCCLFFLFVDDALEVVELLIYFLTNFIFKSFLVADLLLHLLGLLQVTGALHLDIFELLEMHVRSLFEGQSFTPVTSIIEVAIITEGSIVGN